MHTFCQDADPKLNEKLLRIESIYVQAKYEGAVREHAKYHDIPIMRGVTVCTVENEDRTVLATGYAFCSETDPFSRRTGRLIAQNRALAQIA